MRAVLLVVVVFISIIGLSQTPGEWTWVHGTNNSYEAVFGTQGIASDDVMPMSLYEARSWVDLDGNLWLYGGMDINEYSGVSNYLWRFEPGTEQWTWMKGNEMSWTVSPEFGIQGLGNPSVNPGPVDIGNSASWTDLNGNLWLLEANYNLGNCILWKYEISNNQWVWMSGNISANYGSQGIPSTLNNPQVFYESPISWLSDEGDLWFFDGYNGGIMWRYTVATGEWTWMSGDPALGANAPQIEGVQGLFNDTNQPGASWYYSSWKRPNNTFYMFGGIINLNTDSPIATSGMWCYDPSINQWTWLAGQNSNVENSFVEHCTFSAENIPSSDLEFTCTWTSDCGKFFGYNEISGFLWCFDPTINQFALVSGSLETGEPSFGTQGISSESNDPGVYLGASAWVDSAGTFWKLGSTLNNAVYLNTLWKYIPDDTCIENTLNSSLTENEEKGCAPYTVEFNSPANDPNATYLWDFGVTDSTNDQSTEENPSFTFSEAGIYSVQLVINGDLSSICCSGDCDTLIVVIEVISPFIVSVSEDTLCLGETAIIEVGGADSYSWSPSSGLNTSEGNYIEASPEISTVYTVTGFSDSGCSVDLDIPVYVEECIGIDEIFNGPYTIFPNPTNTSFNIEGLLINSPIRLFTHKGELVKSEVYKGSIDISTLPNGVYYVSFFDNTKEVMLQVVKK